MAPRFSSWVRPAIAPRLKVWSHHFEKGGPHEFDDIYAGWSKDLIGKIYAVTTFGNMTQLCRKVSNGRHEIFEEKVLDPPDSPGGPYFQTGTD